MTPDEFKKFSGRIIAYRPELVDIAGTHTAALLLSQLIYHSRQTDDGWFAVTQEHLSEEVRIAGRHLRRLIAKLTELGFLETRQKLGYDRTLRYRVCFDAICEKFNKIPSGQSVQMQPDNMSASHPDNMAGSHADNMAASSIRHKEIKKEEGSLKVPDEPAPLDSTVKDALQLAKGRLNRIPYMRVSAFARSSGLPSPTVCDMIESVVRNPDKVDDICQ